MRLDTSKVPFMTASEAEDPSREKKECDCYFDIDTQELKMWTNGKYLNREGLLNHLLVNPENLNKHLLAMLSLTSSLFVSDEEVN